MRTLNLITFHNFLPRPFITNGTNKKNTAKKIDRSYTPPPPSQAMPSQDLIATSDESEKMYIRKKVQPEQQRVFTHR